MKQLILPVTATTVPVLDPRRSGRHAHHRLVRPGFFHFLPPVTVTLRNLIIGVALILAFAGGTAAILTVDQQPAIAKEPCDGLGCQPPGFQIMHAPAHRATLPLVW
jgi:hypothetical protein